MNSRITNLKGEEGAVILTNAQGLKEGLFEVFVPFEPTTFTVCAALNWTGANPTTITWPVGVPQYGTFTGLHVATGGVMAYHKRD